MFLDINLHYYRVHENWPLYDVLKLFQKGHSHMAVVVKCKKDPKQTSKDPKARPDFTSIRIQSNPELTQADGKGKSYLDYLDL